MTMKRYKEGNILFAKFTEQDVLAGKLVSDGSELEKLIKQYRWSYCININKSIFIDNRLYSHFSTI